VSGEQRCTGIYFPSSQYVACSCTVLDLGLILTSSWWIEVNPDWPALLHRYLLVRAGDAESASTVQPSDGFWHYVCTSWNKATFTASIRLDIAQQVSSFTVGSTGVSFARPGCFVLGQQALATDSDCSSFNSLYSYEGYMADVTLWQGALSTQMVSLRALLPVRLCQLHCAVFADLTLC
jgi:hypothetical protein